MSDSDESLNTEDLNEINSIDNKTYEDVPVKSVERSKQTKRVPIEKEIENEVLEEPLEKSKPLKKARTEKQKQNIENLVKRNKERAEARKKARAEGKIIDEKPLGRKSKAKPKEEIVVNREIQKIIYMIPDGQGGFEKHLNKPRISKKDIQYQKNVMEVEKEELITGKVLLKTKQGKLDNRSKTRSPAQIKATEALVARAKKKREDAKKSKMEAENSQMEQIKDEVHNTIVDVVKTPANQIKKREIKQRPAITEEDRKIAKEKKIRDLFS